MYDFDEVLDRRNTGSVKWDVGENELPMWVADMDFRVLPDVTQTIEDIAARGAYGYTDVTDAWYAAYMDWWETYHSFKIEKDWLMFCTGVVPAISSIVRRLTLPAEKVVLQTPCYNIFYNSVVNNGRYVAENRLIYENGAYRMDFEDLEEKLSDRQTALLILCNPQNPVGRIWTEDELAMVGELCKKYNVTVVSDEIHCDITAPGKEYVPFARVTDTCKDISISLIAPTKCFNLAGIGTSAIVIPDENIRHKVWRGINNDEIAEPNIFACECAVSAFTYGRQWLEEMCEYVFENKRIVGEYIQQNIPSLKLVGSEATYLCWLDCSVIGMSSTELARRIRKISGLYLSDGTVYGPGGEYFLRMNVACPRALLNEGLLRLKNSIEEIRSDRHLV